MSQKLLSIVKYLYTLFSKLLILIIYKFNKIDLYGKHFKLWMKFITVLGLTSLINKEHSKESYSDKISEIFSKAGTLIIFGWMQEILSNLNKILKPHSFQNIDILDLIKSSKILFGKLLWLKVIQSYGQIKIKVPKSKLHLALWSFLVFLLDDIFFYYVSYFSKRFLK